MSFKKRGIILFTSVFVGFIAFLGIIGYALAQAFSNYEYSASAVAAQNGYGDWYAYTYMSSSSGFSVMVPPQYEVAMDYYDKAQNRTVFALLPKIQYGQTIRAEPVMQISYNDSSVLFEKKQAVNPDQYNRVIRSYRQK